MRYSLDSRTITAVVGLLVISVIALIVAVGAAYVRDDTTGSQLLWTDDEAYAIVGVRRIGWSGSYAHLARQVALSAFGRTPEVATSRSWMVITRISADHIDTQVVEGATFGYLWPFEGAIYNTHGGVERWTGREFTPVSDDERVRFAGRSRPETPIYDDESGWSSRGLHFSGDPHVEVPLELQGTHAIVIAERGEGRSRRTRLAVVINGRDPVEVVSTEGAIRYVSQTEYRRLMARGTPWTNQPR